RFTFPVGKARGEPPFPPNPTPAAASAATAPASATICKALLITPPPFAPSSTKRFDDGGADPLEPPVLSVDSRDSERSAPRRALRAAPDRSEDAQEPLLPGASLHGLRRCAAADAGALPCDEGRGRLGGGLHGVLLDRPGRG